MVALVVSVSLVEYVFSSGKRQPTKLGEGS